MDKDRKINKKLIIFAIIGAIAVPPVLNALLCINIPTAPDLGNQDWLSFWGGYLGGIVGMVGTIIALLISYQQNKQLHKDAKKQNKMFHKSEQKQRQESLRLQILPYISVSNIDYDFNAADKSKNPAKDVIDFGSEKLSISPYDGTINTSTIYKAIIRLTNNGLGTVVRILLSCEGKIRSVPLHDLAPKAFHTLCLFISDEREYFITIHFEDIYNNRYIQTFSFNYQREPKIFTLTDTSFPKLIKNQSFVK